ncbi:STAS domain-containing protein [Marinobacter sp.]|uniref:STAS domain-containing protein n=1 Tax=Marinobacter sp. TaxID=50741 RepID=UPI002B26916F|nr:STAS domain-containing protein [Marinobacter sp.]
MNTQQTNTNQSTVEVVQLPEKLVMANSDEAHKRLQSLIAEGKNRLVIDLGSMQFMDSSGLAVLVGAWKTVRNDGGKVHLVSPSPSIRALLELTRLHEIFEIFEDLDAARADAIA